MGNRRTATACVVVAVLLVSGCTGFSESAAPSDPSSAGSPVSAPSGSTAGNPSASTTLQGESAEVSEEEAQVLLDQAVDAMLQQDSGGYASDTVSVIDGESTSVDEVGAWTRKPLAWSIRAAYDRPKLPHSTWLDGDVTMDVIYLQSSPRRVYYRSEYQDMEPIPWVLLLASEVRQWRSHPRLGQDLTTPGGVGLLTEVEATAATTSGQSVAIAGTIPTPQALEALLLTLRVGDLGFTARLAESTTRVLVTIGADGLPASLEFTGAGIGVTGLELPDYLLEEFARARFFAEYGETDRKGPIKEPKTTVLGG